MSIFKQSCHYVRILAIAKEFANGRCDTVELDYTVLVGQNVVVLHSYYVYSHCGFYEQ